MDRPNVFNYQDYVEAKARIEELQGEIIQLHLENEHLRKGKESIEAIIKEEKILLEDYNETLYDYLIYCPVCDEFIGYATEVDAKERFNYCHKCGQKIKVNFDEGKIND